MIESENLKQWEHCKLYEQMIEDVTMKSTATESTLPTFFLSATAWVFGTFLCVMLFLNLSGCSEPTVGQQFRDIMAEIDAKCRKEGIGPYLSPDEPPRSRKRTDSSCDILKIKPADPLATEEGRFAYSINLPPPHDKPIVEYRKGMSAERYFKALCEKEAGEFVFRTVEGVDGIKIMRPFPPQSLPFYAEMTASFQLALFDTTPSSLVEGANGVYSYVDAIEIVYGSQHQTQMVHYYFDPKLPARVSPYGVAQYPITKSQARYGYTFRSAALPDAARENGIVGGELIILDIVTEEVLAYRRIFTRMHFVDRQSAETVAGTICMNIAYQKGGEKFLAEVLKPAAKTQRDTK